MKKVCVVTASRSEYGLMRWIIDEIHHDGEIKLQLVVTGAHLSPDQGLTYKFIEKDGYPISEKVPMLLSSNDEVSIAKSMGVCSISLADTFNRLQPDLIVVLGDRYELLPIVSTAVVLRIPIAHIGGGDITEGAIDNEVRNAVTMMSTLHFPGVEEATNNIMRMRGSDNLIYKVGELGLDSFNREKLWSKEETAQSLHLKINKKWCLVTLHPETKLTLAENVLMAKSLGEVMRYSKNVQFVITKANADTGGMMINNFWSDIVSDYPEYMQLYSSLGHIRYLSFMKHADMILGNSSSGMIEAPFLGTPVVNIGDRQKGRHICSNVICCERSTDKILEAFNKAQILKRSVDKYWGDGNSSERVVSHIKDYLYEYK